MSDGATGAEPVVVVAAAPRSRGWPLLAWVVILLMVVVSVCIHLFPPIKEGAAVPERASMILVDMPARYLLGASRLLGEKNEAIDAQITALNTGPVDQRLRAIVLVGERKGPEAALQELDALEQKLALRQIPLSPRQQRLKDILEWLYTDYRDGHLDAPSLTVADRTFLRSQLGWFGELALAPANGPDPAARQAVLHAADRAALALLGAFLLYGTLLVAGLLGLIVFANRVFTGKWRRAFNYRSPYGGIYAETFALWMVVYLGLSVAAAFVAPPQARLLMAGGALLLSLVVLAWPVLRGVSWRQVRLDIGLFPGRRPARELLIGLVSYALAIPLLAIGLMLVLILLGLQRQAADAAGDHFGSNGLPVHPIVEFLTAPNWWNRAQVLLLACVVAPLVEETMFRGVLYRHLRDASARWGEALSILVSGIVVSFIFAVIHPQGLLAVPALMALAFVFAMVREWRGTVVPGMVAHALNNGLIMILLMLVLGS